MFASIAHRYDLLNRILSFSFDRHWRYLAVRRLAPSLTNQSLVLDLCTGTGDLAVELSSVARVVGCDFCRPMLTLGQEKIVRCKLQNPISFVEGDALYLPFSAGNFDAVTIAFGLRNLQDYTAGLREIYRVLQPGGSLAILEFSKPKIPFFSHLYLFYFNHILPRIGQYISGEVGPYSYLPESVGEFPNPQGLQRLLHSTGFLQSSYLSLTLGVVGLYLCRKPREAVVASGKEVQRQG